MAQCALNLSELVKRAESLQQIRKGDLQPGDWVYVKTCNSLYVIRVLGNQKYIVSGGWFDRKGLSPMRLTINGCTWGGSIIKIDLVAASGLCLEFGNRLVTSAIKKVVVFPLGCTN